MKPIARRVAFAAIAIGIASIATVLALFVLDLYLHKRAERSAGLNTWGYRGPVAGQKRPGEVRVVVLGGSTVFGYGVSWEEAFPARLEQAVNATDHPGPRVSVVNLGYNNEGAYSFRYTLQDYAYLQPDVICLYEGYNDIAGDVVHANHSVFRHESPVFRLVGYFPILPLVLREKAMAMRFGGDLNRAYVANGKTVFRPTLTTRATTGTLDAVADITDSLEQQLGRLAPQTPFHEATSASGDCASPWADYCASVAAAVNDALSTGRQVLFITQPYLRGELAHQLHTDQQHAVVTMLERRYRGRRGFHYVDLGSAIDLNDKHLAFDGMHLTATGNQRLAEKLEPSVSEAARAVHPNQ